MVGDSPCVDVGGLLPSITGGVVDYLDSGDVPNHVLKDAINRRVNELPALQ